MLWSSTFLQIYIYINTQIKGQNIFSHVDDDLINKLVNATKLWNR